MASRSLPQQYQGVACPLEASFAYVHGPNAAVATLKMKGNLSPPVGTQGYFHIGPQQFFGFITNRQYNARENVTNIRFVDWRDRLHDRMVFFQLNMQESDGRFYHILPQDWTFQQRTWITPDLPQWDLPAPGVSPLAADAFHASLYPAGGQLISAKLILEGLAAAFDFVVHCESFAHDVFENSFPLNLDGNSGMSPAALIEMVLSKSGLIWDCKGRRDLYVHLRGFTENAFLQAFTQTLDPCLIGAYEGELGEDLNENGRRVKLLGERNRYELVYLLRPNWNPKWTWQLAFGGVYLSALLESLNLTIHSKLEEMPEEYWDVQTWPDAPRANQGFVDARAIRNKMTIREYLDKYVYKCYVVDFSHRIVTSTLMVVDEFEGTYDDGAGGAAENIKDYAARFFDDWDVVDKTGAVRQELMAWNKSIAPHLVSDSNSQFQLYCTSRRIVRGLDHPFADQLTFTPKNEGASLDFEEMWLGDSVSTPTVGDTYGTIVRAYFSQPQFFVKPGGQFVDPEFIQPDTMAIALAVDREVYTYIAGEDGSRPRVREKILSIRNLRKSFINNIEYEVLAQNFLEIPGTGGARPGVQPQQVEKIAKQIADCYLFHKAVTTSGTLTFWDRCGMQPDGIVDNVLVTWHAKDGIREVVNFSDDVHRDLSVVLPVMLKVSARLDQEERIVKDRLHAMALEALKGAKGIERTMAVMDKGLHEPGAFYGTPAAGLGVAKDGVVAIGIDKALFDADPIPAGAPVMVGKPRPPAP